MMKAGSYDLVKGLVGAVVVFNEGITEYECECSFIDGVTARIANVIDRTDHVEFEFNFSEFKCLNEEFKVSPKNESLFLWDVVNLPFVTVVDCSQEHRLEILKAYFRRNKRAFNDEFVANLFKRDRTEFKVALTPGIVTTEIGFPMPNTFGQKFAKVKMPPIHLVGEVTMSATNGNVLIDMSTLRVGISS